MRKGVPPRLFFPSEKEGAGSVKDQFERAREAFKKASEEGKKRATEEQAKAAGDAMKQGKGKFFAKAFGFGILGSVLGCVLPFPPSLKPY